MVVAVLISVGPGLFAIALGLPAATFVVALAGFVAGLTEGIFEVIWITALQQRVTRAALARVSAYDTVGSFVFLPVGLALAGPAAEAFGSRAVLFAAAGFALVSSVIVAALPSVRALRRLEESEVGVS